MDLILNVLILFIVLNCICKLSLWRLWQRMLFCLFLGGFALWSVRYAVLQSKTQIAGLLQQTSTLQIVAILVTIESAVGLAFCLSERRRQLLFFYPSLLMFPVTFYLLTQAVFTLTGMNFETTAVLFALALVCLLPLFSEAVRRLLSDEPSRMEMHLLLTIFVCILGLAATEQGHLVYTSDHLTTTFYMDIISRALFGIANALLIPDILLLIFFFVRALILLGSTYSQLMMRRKDGQLLDDTIKELQPKGISLLRKSLPEKSNSLFIRYLTDLLEHPASEEYADYLISHYETEVAKDVNLARLLTKLGPVLGLIGTLISMSPALVGLSTGDISGMAYNMQVVFSATVVGLVISAVGLFTQQLKTRWYAKDVNRLDFVSRIYQQSHEKEA